MTGSPFAFLQSKIKGKSWSINLSLGSLCRRCKPSRDERSPESGTASVSSPTTSSFSKKTIFSKRSARSLWRCRRESRDDFGNRWSKIYLPGYSRSSTPLPDIYPVASNGEEEPENSLNFENTITGLGYLEMMYDDHEIFGTRAAPNNNNPYLCGVEHPAKRRISWLSWGSSLHLTLSRPSTRGLQKSG